MRMSTLCTWHSGSYLLRSELVEHVLEFLVWFLSYWEVLHYPVSNVHLSSSNVFQLKEVLSSSDNVLMWESKLKVAPLCINSNIITLFWLPNTVDIIFPLEPPVVIFILCELGEITLLDLAL